MNQQQKWRDNARKPSKFGQGFVEKDFIAMEYQKMTNQNKYHRNICPKYNNSTV